MMENTHNDEGYMTNVGTDVDLLSRLSQGVHVRYKRDGRTYTGMVLDNPLPTSDGVYIRIRSDQNREVTQVPYQQIIQIEH